jgi:predicted CoA-binding protein
MKTVVLGASSKPSRYAYLAVKSLQKHGHKVIPIGRKAQTVENWEIYDGKPAIEDVHTVTLYLGAKNQTEYFDYLLKLKPQRVIFNPGAENDVLEEHLQEAGIETLQACTLVMLNTGQY